MDTHAMHRHFSDTLAFAPRNPSRLGPGRPPPRGTVSMPTSPVLHARAEPLWADPVGPPHNLQAVYSSQPQSAQAFFNHPEQFEQPPWYPYASSSDSVAMSVDDETHQAEPVRKKRAQVRIACTHCQKACKKCSNTRPCDRCVKYGHKDCVDSTRKPRKTGVKRGPYKRRSSGKYHPFYEASYAAQPFRDSTDHMDLQDGALPGLNADADLGAGPPGPRTAALHGAFASALNGPRWENGQRPDMAPEAMYPPTPTVPFPFGLHHRDDPFSRAVSPIRGHLGTALDGLKPGHDLDTIHFTDPFAQQTYSVPSSPHQWEPHEPASTDTFTVPLGNASPAMIALNKIRKPSLRTLMSHGGSQASSRQTSPVPESPTLFDQPMPIDESMEVDEPMAEEPKWEPTPKDDMLGFDIFHSAT